MQRAKLTNGAVEKFRVRDGRDQDTLWCGETRGFGVRVSTKTGTRTYFIQYRVKGSGRERYITIGRHNDPWRVEQARARAIELKAQMIGDGLTGTDPVAEAERKQAEQQKRAELDAAHSATLRQMLEHYLEHRRTKHGPLRQATKNDIRRHIEKNLTSWLDEPICNITRDRFLAKFVDVSKNAPIQANLLAAYTRAICNHARELHAEDNGDYPILASNPVTKMIRIRKLNPEKARDRRIPIERIGKVWLMLRRRSAEARTIHDQTACDWVSLMLLTGCRLTESASLRWTDVDFAARTLTLRAEVVKNHSELVLPMSAPLHELLAARAAASADDKAERRRRVVRNTEYVFASNGLKTPYMTDARATMEAVSKVAGLHLSPHDLRRSFESVASEVHIDGDVRRMLLNHISGDVHALHYSNDKRRLANAVEAIGKWIVGQATIAEAQENGSNVVPLRG